MCVYIDSTFNISATFPLAFSLAVRTHVFGAARSTGYIYGLRFFRCTLRREVWIIRFLCFLVFFSRDNLRGLLNRNFRGYVYTSNDLNRSLYTVRELCLGQSRFEFQIVRVNWKHTVYISSQKFAHIPIIKSRKVIRTIKFNAELRAANPRKDAQPIPSLIARQRPRHASEAMATLT